MYLSCALDVLSVRGNETGLILVVGRHVDVCIVLYYRRTDEI
jgi:hypothetical protein